MYRRAIILMCVLASVVPAVAQIGCPGFKNTASFVTGYDNYFWSGRVGQRCYSTTNDTTNGYTIKSTCASPLCPSISGELLTSTTYNSGTDPFVCSNVQSIWDNNDRRFQIITPENAGIDGFTVNPDNPGGGLQRIPEGYLTSIRLGDLRATGTATQNCNWTSGSNKGSEALFYTMDVNTGNSLLIINYAVVTRKYNHTPFEAGEFCIRVVRKVNGEWETVPINDSLHYKVSAPAFSGTLPAPWLEGVQGGSEQGGYTCSFCYKPWTKVAINLSRYLYQTVRVEMYTSDCIYDVDPMMAYISGDYQSMTLNTSGCPNAESDIIDTVTALSDMISYQWFVSEIGAQHRLLNADYMETVPFRQVFPPNGGTTTQNFYTPRIGDFVLTDGPNAGDTVADQTVMCIMTSALDPNKPFTSRLYVNVKNMRPMMNPTSSSDCDRTVTFNGNIYTYGEESVDSGSVYWVIYSDTTYRYPVDTIYGVNTSYTFDSAGRYAVLLHGQTLEHGCESVKRIICTANDRPPAGMSLSHNTLCDGDTLTLQCTEGTEYSKRWTVGEDIYTSSAINPLNVLRVPMTQGVYEVTLETGFGKECTSVISDSVVVYGVLNVSVGSDVGAICAGDTVHLYASGNRTYNWISEPHDNSLDGQEHEASITVVPQQSTLYTVLPEEGNFCTEGDVSRRIEVWPYPEAVISCNRHRVSVDDPVVRLLDSTEGTNTTQWRFSDGYSDEGRMVTHTFVLGDEDSVSIWMESCNRVGCCDTAMLSIPIGSYNLWFPNAFIPKEETNNTFGVVGTIPFEEYEIFIYNRMGLLVFSSTDPGEKWDGKDQKGNPCPQGAYVYYYRYKSDNDGYFHDGKGTVMLLR